MDKLLDGFPVVLAASGTVWLALGLTAAWLLRRRPARAHSLLTMAAAGALATPLLVVTVQRANWGLLPAAVIEAPVAAGTPVELPGPSPGEFHAALTPQALPYPESPERDDRAAIPAPSPMPINASALPWQAMTVWVWFALSTALALRLLVDVAAGWGTVRRSRPATDAVLVQALKDAAMRIGLVHTSSSTSREQRAWPLPRSGAGAGRPSS